MAQPDFAIMAQGAAALCQQLALLGNLPALDGGAAIIQRLDALSEQMTNLRTELRAKYFQDSFHDSAFAN
jgi:uncharacterized protein HemX